MTLATQAHLGSVILHDFGPPQVGIARSCLVSLTTSKMRATKPMQHGTAWADDLLLHRSQHTTSVMDHIVLAD
eukprot:2937971-Amphidinium_carterae.1